MQELKLAGLTKEEKLDVLFMTPRMGHVGLDDGNSVKGLYEMIQKYFKSDFEMVEVGSFMGVSTLLFSLFVKKIYSVDCYDYVVPASGRIPTHDQLFIDAERIFLERTSNIENIIKIKKPSIDASLDFEDYSLDAVYIDAEHDYHSVSTDVFAWKKKVKPGGILCGHDFNLPHIHTILKEQKVDNELSTYSDTSWSVIIK